MSSAQTMLLLVGLLPLLYHASGLLRRGKMPPLLSVVPETSFNCANHNVGYYADMEADCQAYHMCDPLGKQFSYLCPNMTVFNQRFMVCDHWHHVNCSASGKYYVLNERMAGGGKKLPQASRLANLIQIDRMKRRQQRNNVEANKSSQSAFNNKAMMKKIKNDLLNSQRRVPGATRRANNQHSRINKTRTTLPHNIRATTQSSILRPRSRTTQSFPRRSQSPNRWRRPPLPKVNRNPGRSNLPPATRRRSPSISSPPRSSPFAFTEVLNFSKRNQSKHSVAPRVRMVPGMVARGSGPQFEFGFTNLVKPPAGHRDVPRQNQNNLLLLEISRQLLLPRQRSSRRIFDGKAQTVPSNNNVGVSPARPIIPRSSTSSFMFPKNNNRASFPIRPVIFNRNSTPRPFVMTGPRQEDITELEARRNGRNKLPINQAHFKSSVHGSQAFFIPETRLIPPDNIAIRDNVTPAATKALPRARAASSENDSSEDETDDYIEDRTKDDQDTKSPPNHMTMIFPESRPINLSQRHDGMILNPNCPKCHPAFLTPGKCTPCVRIR